ncbi:MAG: PKD domain-containing protein [Cytophagales bacterium]
MKKNLLLILFFFQIGAINAIPIFIEGTITDTSGIGIPQKIVEIYRMQTFVWTPFDTDTTDANGIFRSAGNLLDSTAQFQFLTYDCNGDTVIWTDFWDTNISDSLITSIQICNGLPISCSADFDFQFTTINTFNFQALNNQNPIGTPSYQWDFGDGNTSNLANPNHVYNTWNQYEVCLNYSDSSCSDTICKKVNNAFEGTQNLFFEIRTVDASGNPVANNPVYNGWGIRSKLIGDTVITDSSGYYSRSGSVHTYSALSFWIFDCNGDTVIKNFFMDSNTDSISVTFNTCGDTVVSCNEGSLNHTVKGYNVYSETDFPNGGDVIYTYSYQHDWGFNPGQDSVAFTYPSFYPKYAVHVMAFNRFCFFYEKDSNTFSNTCRVDFDYLIKDDTAEFFSQVNPQPPPGALYLWDFGDGGSSNHINPVHTYSNAGTYVVCLTYNDGACFNTVCDTIQISNGTCSFSYTYQDFGSAFGFFGIDSLANPSSSYIWNFGDGNSSTGFNAVHNYQNPGMYNVCLEKLDSLNFCTYCDSILVSFDTSLLDLGGNIGINLISRSGDMVILYEETNSGTAPFIQALDTTINVNGAYVFHGLNPGAYSLRVMPENNSNDPGLIPQYWQNEFYWGNAGSIILNSSQQGINFNFTNNPNSLSGPASVVISVRDSFNQYISNAVVWIEDLNQTIIQFDITDQNSNVVFDNLPFGDYKVGTDYPGYYMFKEDVSLSNAFPRDSIGLSIQNGWLATSIKQQIVNTDLSLFPNPIVDEFYLNEDLRDYALVLRNIEAKKIALDINYSESHTRIRFKERPQSGLYILQIITKQGIICKKLFVR